VASVVRSLVRQLRGRLSLHGSVVAFGDDAVAFVGVAFSGKSTLAHACMHHARAELVADDTVAFTADAREPRVEPVQRGTWLLAESRDHFGLASSDERKVMAEHPVAGTPKRLRLIVLLQHHADDALEDELVFVRGVETFRLVSPHIFRFVERNPEQHRRELDALADRLPNLRVAVLCRARRFDRLTGHVALVQRALESLRANER
jgi:pimeloyl-ACP methyl ester carboxylesterase